MLLGPFESKNGIRLKMQWHWFALKGAKDYEKVSILFVCERRQNSARCSALLGLMITYSCHRPISLLYIVIFNGTRGTSYGRMCIMYIMITLGTVIARTSVVQWNVSYFIFVTKALGPWPRGTLKALFVAFHVTQFAGNHQNLFCW